jgi:YHS domain-containing protein
MVKDPICGMEMESQQSTVEFGSKHYFFCLQRCFDRFKQAPRESDITVQWYVFVISDK